MRTCLYIDPGTGSMLFTIIIGILSTAVFFLRSLAVKVRFAVTGGKSEALQKDREKPDYVIFCESKRYWNVFKPVCEEFEKRKIPAEYYTAAADDPVFDEKYEYIKPQFIGEGNKAFAKLNLMKAKIVLATTPGLEVLQWKRSKDVDFYVHIYHTVDDGLFYRMFGVDFYDAVLLTGAFQERYIRMLEQMRHLPAKETPVTGSTYMDSLMERAAKHTVKPSENKLILVAPSWGESSILNRFGEKIIEALLKTGYDIVIRPHPQMAISDPELLAGLRAKYPDSNRLKWNFDNDNFDILSRADLMITDFSGVISDYCYIFDKPVIVADTSVDTAPYDAAWIDEPLWRFKVLPKLGPSLNEEQFGDLKKTIDELTESDDYRQSRNEVKAVAWNCIGEAAKLTVDYLVKKNAELSVSTGENNNEED